MIRNIFLKLTFNILKKVHDIHADLLFLPKIIKAEKFQKLVASLLDKTEYIVHIWNLKLALNQVVLKKIHSVIKFNQEAWLKPYIDSNTKLRKNAKKKWFWKRFFQVDE